MEVFLSLLIIALILALVLVFLFEFRIRQPDVLVLYEKNGQLSLRRGLIYPRHFSLPLKRLTSPIQIGVQAAAAGNLGVNVKLIGSVAPAVDHLGALIRVGGWNSEAVARAADETSILLEGLVKEYAEQREIHELSSTGLLEFLNARAEQIKQVQSNIGRAQLLGRHELLDGDAGLLNTELDRFLEVTGEDIQSAARRYFDPAIRAVLEIIPGRGEGDSR